MQDLSPSNQTLELVYHIESKAYPSACMLIHARHALGKTSNFEPRLRDGGDLIPYKTNGFR